MREHALNVLGDGQSAKRMARSGTRGATIRGTGARIAEAHRRASTAKSMITIEATVHGE